MWKAFLLCFLVALSVAEQQNGAWRQNIEYRYKVHTKTLAALPNLKNQWVGSFTKADLMIRQVSKDVLIGEVKNGKRSDFHDALPVDPANYMPDDQLQYEKMEMNTKPFEIRLNEGAIHSVAVDQDMTNVQLNQLKSILSQLQVDVQSRNKIESIYNHLPKSVNDQDDSKQDQAFYKVMEPTIMGKCESYYDISRVPMYVAQSFPEVTSNVTFQSDENVYEIFKTKNFSNCEQRMGYHFGLDGMNKWKPNTNRMGSLTKSAVSRIVVTGNMYKYVIRSSVTTNRVVKSNPDKESQQDSVVVSQVNVTLESMRHNEEKPQMQSDRLVDVGNLVYSYDLPSDKKNSLRPKMDSSEELDDSEVTYEHDDNHDFDADEEPYEENATEEEDEVYKTQKHSRENRSRRSTDNKISKSDDSEMDNNDENDDNESEENNSSNDSEDDNEKNKKKSKSHHKKEKNHKNRKSHKKGKSQKSRKYSRNESYESDESFKTTVYMKREYHQPRPTMKDAPENPLLPYFVGNNGKSIQSRNEFEMKAAVEKVVKEISEDLENPEEMPAKNTLRKFNILAKIIRTMNSEEIEETTRTLENMDKKTSEKVHKVYRDALSTAGTGPAVNELMKMIEERKLKGEEAAEVVLILPATIREPTEDMQRRFFEFVKNDVVREQSNVNTTAGMALTRFLYQAQVNRKWANKYYPVHSYGHMGDRSSKFVSDEVVPYFVQMMKNGIAKKDVPKTLYAIRALGNMADSKLPKVFEPYLSGKERLSDFQRFAMVVAMNKYFQNHVKESHTILYKIFQDKGETNEIRSVAVFQLVRSKPVSSILLRMAESTNNEGSNEYVRAAVRSALESAARCKVNIEFADNARAALSLMKPETKGMQYPGAYLKDFVDRQVDATHEQKAAYVVNEDSFLPNGVFLRTVGNLYGFKHNNEFHAIVSSVKELVNAFDDNIDKTSKNSKQNNRNENDRYSNESSEKDYLNKNSNQKQSVWSAEKIMDMLQMKPNTVKKLEGQILMSFANSERFFAFDRQTLDQLPKTLKKMMKELRNGHVVEYTKFFNWEDAIISFPLETGLPFTFTQRSPTFIQVQSKVHVQTTPDMNENDENDRNTDYNKNKMNKVQVPNSVNVTADIELTFSTNNEVSMWFIEPSTGQRYAASYDKKAQVNVPLRFSSNIDIVNREVMTEVKPLRADKDVKILQMETVPFTVRENIFKLRPMPESQYAKKIYSKSARPWNVEFGENQTGFAFKMSGKQEKGTNQFAKMMQQLHKRDLTSILMFGLWDTSVEPSSLTVTYDGPKSTSKSMKLTVKYDKQNANNNQNQVNHNKNNNEKNRSHPRFHGKSAEDESYFTKPDSPMRNSQERRAQLMRNAVEDMGVTNGASLLDVSVELDGLKKREYVVTMSTASSKTEGKSRILVFARKTEKESQEKMIYLQVDAKYQNVDERSQLYQDNNKPYADVKFTLTTSIDMESKTVHGQVGMKQSTEYNESFENLSPNTVDHIDIELDVNDDSVKMLEKSFNFDVRKYYNYLRYRTSMFLSENKEYTDGQKDKVRLEVRLSSNMKSADLTLKTENMKTEWKGLPVPMAQYFAIVPSNGNLFEEMKREYIQYRDTCVISDHEINTFENRTVKTHDLAKNTWYLAVHQMRDSNEDMNFNENENDVKKHEHYVSVLVRDVQESNRYDNDDENVSQYAKRVNRKNKEVLIVLHQKNRNDIVLRLAPRDNDALSSSSQMNVPRLFVDENEKEMSTKSSTAVRSTENPEMILARVYVTKEKPVLDVEIVLGNLQVKYDGKSVLVRSKSMYRTNRGVCGAFTGRKINDLKSPQNKIINNDKEFVTSWAVVENDSNMDNSVKKLQKSIKQKQYPSEQIIYSDPIPNVKKSRKQQQNQNEKESVSNVDSSEQRRYSNSNNIKLGTKHQTQFVEDHKKDRICFSKRPLPVCPSGTRANGRRHEKVEVICRPSNDPAAQQYKSQIKQGRNVNMSMHTSNDSLTFSIPKRCE